MVNAKKTETVKYYVDTIKQSAHLVLIQFDKVTHPALEGLRRDLSQSQTKMKVVKNSLLEKAVNRLLNTNQSFVELKKRFFPLQNKTAVITFAKDWTAGLKTIYAFAKKGGDMSFKCAVIDATTYDDAALVKLAQLPGRNALIAQLINAFRSPMRRLVYSCQYNTNQFVYILQQKAKK
ncbi:50S ribosomal protein L10 [Patescibacteria group bacterium]|nr:50S ribosomal protein L10 [Patescibacteria group bacterium]MCL5091796.1 50S ribosomal protein L10 [Patescibacteria group bacterium]